MPSEAVLDDLRKLKAPLDESEIRFKWLLYGESGVGKTIEALQLAQLITPKDKRILHVDTGEGWVSVNNHPQLKQRTDRMIYQGLSQFEALVEAIEEDAEGFDNYGTIIFDEFSTSTKKFLHVVLDTNNVKVLTEGPEFKHWGIMSRNIENTIWALLRLKETHNLIFIAHERTRENKRTKLEMTRPSFQDSIEGVVKENVHVVSRMTGTVDNREGTPMYTRELQVHPTKMVVAKSRVGGLEILTTPSTFNQVVVDWMNSGGQLVDEQEVVELSSEREVSGDFSSQTDFTGFETE